MLQPLSYTTIILKEMITEKKNKIIKSNLRGYANWIYWIELLAARE